MEPLDPSVQAIFDQAAVGIAQIGLDGVWLRVNNRYCQMLGYSEAELRAKTPQDINHADDWAEVLAGRGRLLEGAITSHSLEKRYVRKDGTVFWGRLNQSLVRDHDNLPQYFIAVVEDITEKIQAERALNESERRLELALGAAGLGFWDRDLRTGVTVISGEYARLHGLAPNHAPLSHEEWLKLVHPDDRNRVDEQYRQSLERTHFWDTEFRLVWPDGSVHWILAKGRVFLDNLRCPVRLAGISIDITERKRGEEQRSRLASIVESSEDAIFSKDLDGTITSWNSGAEKLFGYTAEEIIGQPLSLLLPPERLDEFPLILQRIRSGAHLEHYEVPRMCKDGRRVEISVAISPIKDSAGAVVGSSTIARQISERKHMEEVLRQSEERFRLAIKATNDAIWDIDLKTGTVSWNETYSTLYDRPPETSDSWQWWIDRIHPEDREVTVGEFRAAISSSASSWTREYRFQRADGRWAHIYDRAYIARDGSGKAWRVIGAMQDLTTRKQAEAALRESEARLMNAQRLARVGSWERNLETDNIDWSDEMLRILGVSNNPPSTLAAFLNHVHPKDREKILEAVDKAGLSIAPLDLEYRVIRPDGEARSMHSIIEAVRDDQGVPVRIMSATQDITDSRRAQEEGWARQKLESIGTLASGIAHDFNNVLGGVLAQADLAVEELASGSNPAEQLRGIRKLAIRGSEIVRQLLVYAGIESEVSGLLDISQIVKEIVELLKVSISKHATLETDLGQGLPAVRGSGAQLRQIVMNLVMNASEALGERDGVIRVATRCVPVGRIATITEDGAEGDWLQLEVSDTGCGMTQETKARVFDPFFTTKSAGHGLGLAVVYGIVRALRGSVHVATESGKGSTFQVLLPCAAKAAGSANDPISGAGDGVRSRQRLTVMVVEDEDLLRQAVVKMLLKAGFDVLEAANGSAAIDLLRANGGNVDVILLDATIPGASSHAVVVEAAEARPDVRVVLTSAYGPEMITGAMEAPQIRGFIRKPFQLGDLVQTLRSALLVPASSLGEGANFTGASSAF
jgi:two-component system, cell cycle sensor histidine kinase and response regulator CckA